MPRQQLSIPVAVAGVAPGSNAYVTVAAVDVGILNLTNYKAPDPENWFFGQRMLGMEVRDLYGRLIDGSLGVAGKLRTGGDGANMQTQGSPPTEKLVAFFSGPVQLDADGKARIDFDIPQFNGTVRVMAVAWTKEAVGHAQTDVIVRDPVVLAGTLPRFLAVGDQSRFHMQIDNVEGPAGAYTVDLDVKGPVLVAADATRRTMQLNAGAKTQMTIPVTAAGLGRAHRVPGASL